MKEMGICKICGKNKGVYYPSPFQYERNPQDISDPCTANQVEIWGSPVPLCGDCIQRFRERRLKGIRSIIIVVAIPIGILALFTAAEYVSYGRGHLFSGSVSMLIVGLVIILVLILAYYVVRAFPDEDYARDIIFQIKKQR